MKRTKGAGAKLAPIVITCRAIPPFLGAAATRAFCPEYQQ
jgi:hypothetical protein